MDDRHDFPAYCDRVVAGGDLLGRDAVDLEGGLVITQVSKLLGTT